MKESSTKCRSYTYEKVRRRYDKDYDYLWSDTDSYLHKHVDFYELFFISGGSPSHYYKGKKQELRKNQMFFMKPGEEHHLYTEPSQSLHFTFVAKPIFIERFMEENPCFRDLFGDEKCVSCEMTDIEFNYIYTLATTLVHQESEDDMVALLLYNAMMFLKLYNNREKKEKENSYAIDLFEKMSNYEFLTNKMYEIYRYYPVSPKVLIREFKKYTGMTIVQYQKKQKLKYAAQLLVNSSYQVTEIAGKLKYDSFSHFLSIFKEEYGMTPRKYRETHIR